MALGDREEKIYIGTFKGSFIRKARVGDTNVVERVNKLNKTVKEIHFTYIKAHLVDIQYKEGDYGRTVNFILKDGEENYTLQASVKSGLASLIINRLPVLEFDKQVELNIGFNNDKERAWFSLAQGYENIPDYFNEWDDENKVFLQKHKFPKWEQIVVNGETVWDASKQLAYQEKVVEKYVEAIKAAAPADQPKQEMPDQAHYTAPGEAAPMPTTEPENLNEEEDNLPF
ncbi:MAG: hypothetical protein ACTSU6_06125 [Candidatus Njordarchaeales archaeon]